MARNDVINIAALPGSRCASNLSSDKRGDLTVKRWALLEAPARDLENRGKVGLPECFIDGTFALAKKGLHRD